MKIPFYQIDAFAGEVFMGNPAGVCLLNEWLDEYTMLNIADENNLSETAFLVKLEEDNYELKWFTPKAEVDLCGHATLASAYVIFSYIKTNLKEIRFQTLSGELTVKKSTELLEMNFPSTPPEFVEPPQELIDGLKATPFETLKSRDYLAIFQSEDVIEEIKPDFEKLSKLDSLGVIISAQCDYCDFVSRFFAPKVGVNEDPVTGSAHTTLTPYWSEKLGKQKLHANQISRRRGELFLENLGDRVSIAGKAVTYLIGEITI